MVSAFASSPVLAQEARRPFASSLRQTSKDARAASSDGFAPAFQSSVIVGSNRGGWSWITVRHSTSAWLRSPIRQSERATSAWTCSHPGHSLSARLSACRRGERPSTFLRGSVRA